MSEWVVVPCDVCNRQTVTDHPEGMVVCEVCLARWDAEDAEAGLPVDLEDDDDYLDDDEDEPLWD